MAVIKKGIVKSYDAASHKAAVQMAGSLAVWLDSVRVATNIPAADVVVGRQCTVLFLDPSNQDDAVIITIQGALPSNGQILQASATATLTLTTSAQSIVGDGDSTKVRILLPTVGDWLIEATCQFVRGANPSPANMTGELFVNDSGSPESGQAVFRANVQNEIATVTQRWKVTTTAVNTPVELKAFMTGAGGNGTCSATNTRLVASTRLGTLGVPTAPSTTVVSETTFGQAAAPGAASPYSRGDHTHGTPTDPVTAHEALADPHTVYGALAQAETWAALQTFNAHIQLGANGEIRNSAGDPMFSFDTSAPRINIHRNMTFVPGVGFYIRMADQGTIRDDAGNIRMRFQDTSPHIRMNTADVQFDKIGIGSNVHATAMVYTARSLDPGTADWYSWLGDMVFTPDEDSASAILFGANFAVRLNASVSVPNRTVIGVRGNPRVTLENTEVVGAMHGVEGLISNLFGAATGTITEGVNFFGISPSLSNVTLTDFYHFYGETPTTGVNRYGLFLEDITGGTIARLLELGGLLRLLGTGEWTPAANQTPLYLAEGATPTVRQIQWKDGAAIGAGDKVMVLV